MSMFKSMWYMGGGGGSLIHLLTPTGLIIDENDDYTLQQGGAWLQGIKVIIALSLLV